MPLTPEPLRLTNGSLAELRYYATGGYQLVVDGTPQSHVDPDDPTRLVFHYMRTMGDILDELPAGPLTAVHLGGGALTMPRYVEATRPGSRQQVLELQPDLVNYVRELASLPPRASIRIRYGDARESLQKLPAGLHGTVDAVLVDIFLGAATPPHVTTAEFYELVRALLAPHGVVIANIADGVGLKFARSQLATMRHVFGAAALVADRGMLRGKRFGNLIGVAALDDEVLERIPRQTSQEFFPAVRIAGDELNEWVAYAPIITDQTAVGSPGPTAATSPRNPGESPD